MIGNFGVTHRVPRSKLRIGAASSRPLAGLGSASILASARTNVVNGDTVTACPYPEVASCPVTDWSYGSF